MARIVITIEDTPQGDVKIVAEPNFMTMAMMENSGHDLTAAHGYALALLNRAREISKSQSPKNIILLPRVQRV